MIREGHGIGLHGIDPENKKTYESEKSFINEMNNCNDTLINIIGRRTRLIRATRSQTFRWNFFKTHLVKITARTIQFHTYN